MVTTHQPRLVRGRASRLAPDARRAQLLEVAIRVFARRGLSNARPAEVATKGGVSESTVFAYFATRDELVQAVLDEVARFYMQNNTRYLQEQTSSVPATILALGVAFRDSVDSHPDHARVWLDWSNSVGEAIFGRYLDFQERVVELVTSTLVRGRAEGSVAEDVDASDAARMLYMAAQMVVQLKITGNPSREVNRFLVSATRAVVGRPIDLRDVPEEIRPECDKDGKS